MKEIKKIYGWEKKELEGAEIEYDENGKSRPAWIKLKSPVKSKFLTISFGFGNLQYMEFLHSGFYVPINYSKDELRKVYDEFAESYEEVVKVFGKEEESIAYVVDLLGEIGKSKLSKILDVGSGTGRGAELLINRGYENLTLLELSYKMMEKAREKDCLKDCKFVVGEFTEFESDEKYDIITSFYVFGSPIYFSEADVEAGLKKIKSMLNEKGVVVCVGNMNVSLFENYFKVIKSGEFLLRDNLKTFYFIGEKDEDKTI